VTSVISVANVVASVLANVVASVETNGVRARSTPLPGGCPHSRASASTS